MRSVSCGQVRERGPYELDSRNQQETNEAKNERRKNDGKPTVPARLKDRDDGEGP